MLLCQELWLSHLTVLSISHEASHPPGMELELMILPLKRLHNAGTLSNCKPAVFFCIGGHHPCWDFYWGVSDKNKVCKPS